MKFTLVITLFLFTNYAFSHGDHSSPGSLPFAPHGGKVAELESTNGHDHDKKIASKSGSKKEHDKHDEHEDHGKDQKHDEHDDHEEHGKEHKHEDHKKHDKHDGHEEHDDQKEHEGHDHSDEHKEVSEKKTDEHNHDHDHDKEYFIEAVYKDGFLKIYPLAFNPENPKEFELLDARKEITVEEVKVEFPRSKKIHSIEMKIEEDKKGQSYWISKVPDNKDIRFFTFFEAEWHEEDRKAKVHLEKR